MELNMRFILAMMLISKGQALSCYAHRRNASLWEVKECPKDQVCGIEIIGKYYMDNTQDSELWRECFPVSFCGTISWSNGARAVTTNTTCCKTDLCNKNNDSLPVQAPLGAPNGRKCYTCVKKDCTSQMECFGDQSHCLTLGVQKGCASESACIELKSDAEKVSCCNSTDLCNGVNDITQNLLPLILMSLGFISYLF